MPIYLILEIIIYTIPFSGINFSDTNVQGNIALQSLLNSDSEQDKGINVDSTVTDNSHHWMQKHAEHDLKIHTLQYRGSRYTKDSEGTYVHDRKRVGQKMNTPIDAPAQYIDREGQVWYDESMQNVHGGRQIFKNYSLCSILYVMCYSTIIKKIFFCLTHLISMG